MTSVLIVHSDPMLRRYVATALGRMGYVVRHAETGSEAIRMLAGAVQDPVDLLVSEVVLKGINGVELASQARMLDPTIEIMMVYGFSVVSLDLCVGSRDRYVVSPAFHLGAIGREVASRLGGTAFLPLGAEVD